MIETSIKLVKQWLTANAPRIVELSMNPGASLLQLAALENTVGKTLPPDFIELYSTWNGMSDEENWGNLFYGLSFSTIDEIIADHQSRARQSRREDPVPLKKASVEIDSCDSNNPAWLQIGTDGSRSGLRLDLAPAAAGRYGQIIYIDGDHEAGICVAHSTLDLLWKFANDLSNNLYTLQPDAVEEGQHFLDPAKEIDLMHWHGAERWRDGPNLKI